jgi:D-alanyl-lipoteichoic acid acyltransferase DltB (MBOAT superfamily)
MIEVYIGLIFLYIFIGSLICYLYIKEHQEQPRSKKKINKNKRLLQRLSIILLYPIYIIVFAVLLFIELLTEDKPFQ